MAWGIPGNVGEIYRKQQSDELKDQLLQQTLAQRMKEFDENLKQQREEAAALAEDRRANREYQAAVLARQGRLDTAAEDKTAGQNRAISNIQQLLPVLQPGTPEFRTEAAMQGLRFDPQGALSELTKEPPKPPQRSPVMTPGAGGKPVYRVPTEDELASGSLPAYVPPREPREPRQVNYVWYEDDQGNVREAPEGTARSNERPLKTGSGGLGAIAVTTRNNRTAAALNAVDKLKELAPQRSEGPMGILQGMGKTAMGKVGLDTKAAQYNALLKPTAMRVAVAVQGASNLSDKESAAMFESLGRIDSMDYETQIALLDNAVEALSSSGADVQKVTVKDENGRVREHWVPVQPRGRPSPQTVTPGGGLPDGGGAPQQRPIPGIPGGVAELRNGRWIRVK